MNISINNLNTDNILDLAYLKTYSIDDKDTSEIDDAISLENINNRKYIWIHISSPPLILGYKLSDFKKSRELSSTQYLSNGNKTIFNEDIIRDKLSINPNKRILTLSVRVHIDLDGECDDILITYAYIKSNYKLTYEDADELIDLAPNEEIDLFILYKKILLRANYRLNNGAIRFEMPQGRFKLIDNNVHLKIYERTKSRILVEESMILISEIIGTFFKNSNISVPFRCNDTKPIYNNNFNEKDNIILRNNLSRSYYSISPFYHNIIGKSFYVHCTSPIRRFIDILVHLQLFNIIYKKELISIDTLNSEIKYFEYTNNLNKEITLNDQSYLFSRYINQDHYYKCFFVKWINFNKSYALIYIYDFFIQKVICLYKQHDLNPKDEILVKFIKRNLQHNKSDHNDYFIGQIK